MEGNNDLQMQMSQIAQVCPWPPLPQMATWFEQPVNAVKKVQRTGMPDDYDLTHISFLSTGGTNISSVNALSEVGLYMYGNTTKAG